MRIDLLNTARKKGYGVDEIIQATAPDAIIGVDKDYCLDAHPVTAVVYVFYSLRVPEFANLARIKNVDVNCVAQKMVEHFEEAVM